MDSRAQRIGSSSAEGAASPTFEELAAQQGVAPIDDFETLLGEPLPGDESAEEFSASLREWRRECVMQNADYRAGREDRSLTVAAR